MAKLPPADRPDLKKESLTFSTIEGVGMGAAISASVSGIANGIAKYQKRELPYTLGEIGSRAASWGAGMGIAYMAISAWGNHQKSKEISHLERLAAEAEAKNAAPDTPVTKR